MLDHQKKRRVFITGGTGSVGQALVRTFSSNGDNVTFQYSSNQSKAKELEKSFGAEAIQIDFSKDFSLEKIDFDVVINNAGVNISDVVTHKVTLENWNRTLNINVTVPFRIAQLCLPSMIKKHWGRIINISSIYGLTVAEGYMPYNASKHALSGITKTIAKEYAADGITCNEICPGAIDSEMVDQIATRQAKVDNKSKEEILNEYRNDNPMGRLAMPQEVASLALFLASPGTGYITGVSIPIDGGITT